MKTKSLMLSAAVALAAMTACQDNVVPETPAGNPETYTVKLACAGELEVNHVPLKSSSDDLYGIQVYYAPVSGGSYQYYAYGLFDDVSDVSLELIADYKYKFVVDMIVDGKNVIYNSNLNELEDDEILLGYGAPFRIGHDYNQAPLYHGRMMSVTNEFILSSDGFGSLGERIQLLDGEHYDNPEGVDSYYGELLNYEPQEDGTTISIFMKHMIYGLKVIADEFLTQGIVNGEFVTRYNSGFGYEDSFTLTADSKVYETYFAFTDRTEWYNEEVQNNADVPAQICFSWIKDEDTTLELRTHGITMYRMKQTVVNVTFYEDESAGETTVAMVFDDLEMSENETSYTFGDDQDEYEW